MGGIAWDQAPNPLHSGHGAKRRLKDQPQRPNARDVYADTVAVASPDTHKVVPGLLGEVERRGMGLEMDAREPVHLPQQLQGTDASNFDGLQRIEATCAKMKASRTNLYFQEPGISAGTLSKQSDESNLDRLVQRIEEACKKTKATKKNLVDVLEFVRTHAE